MAENVNISSPVKFDSIERVALDLLMVYKQHLLQPEFDTIFKNKDNLLSTYYEFLLVVHGNDPKK